MKKDTKTYLIITIFALIFTAFLVWCAFGNVENFFDNDQNLEISSVNREEIAKPNAQQGGEVLPDTDNLADLRVQTIENARITAYTKHDRDVNCLSASQKNICWTEENIIACPTKYPFGTIVEIPILYEDTNMLSHWQKYTCLDRMGTERFREGNYFDIWFDDDLAGALDFGVQYHTIKVLTIE